MKIGEKILFENILKWTKVDKISDQTIRGETFISGLSTDTRTMQAGDFFVPVAGDNFDGHDFIAEAIFKGCCGFVFQKDHNKSLGKWHDKLGAGRWKDLLILQTGNTIDFLLRLSHGYIRQFKARTVGITGSVGKTTTKDFISSIMSQNHNVVFTPFNYNTELGVSLSILEIKRNTDFFIAELGMRGKGQIKRLAETADVELAVITAIAPSHLEFFKSVEEIAIAKVEISAGLSLNKGVLFLNHDDEWTEFISSISSCDILRFGRNNKLDYNFIERQCDSFGRYSFTLFKKEKEMTRVKMPVTGLHNVYNACASAAVAEHIGAGAAEIKTGIENAEMGENRMEVFKKNGKIIINDCYNASPLAMRRAIDSLVIVSSKNNSRSVALLSCMLELGPKSAELHIELGEYIYKKGINVLITIGETAEGINDGFVSMGQKQAGQRNKVNTAYHFSDKNDLYKKMDKIIKEGDTILLKGSRANKMEELVDQI